MLAGVNEERAKSIEKIGRNEFEFMRTTDSPTIPENVEIIWILSSRHNINKEHTNCAKKSISYEATDQECDVEDDYQRIKEALELGIALTAKRAGKPISELSKEDFENHAPYILYNGFPAQNEPFKAAVDQQQLTQLGLPAYSPSKILFFDMPKKELHTGGQFISLHQNMENEPLRSLKNKTELSVVIVTSAYHVPRVRRLLSSPTFPNPFPHPAKITLFGIDRNFSRKCALRDLNGELERLKTYSAIRKTDGKSDISIKPYNATWYKEFWTPLRDCKRPGSNSTYTTFKHDPGILFDTIGEEAFPIVNSKHRNPSLKI